MDEIVFCFAMMAGGLWFMWLGWRSWGHKNSWIFGKLFGPANPTTILREMQVESELRHPWLGRFVGLFGALVFLFIFGLLIYHLVVGHNVFIGTYHG